MNATVQIPDTAPGSAARRSGSGPAPVVRLDRTIDIAAFTAIARGDAAIRLADPALDRLQASSERLEACIAEGSVVYGVTTGFGPLANRDVRPGQIEELQRNLIYHLATGVGAPLSFAESRALLLARLMSILQGWSGASTALVGLMVEILNRGLAPWVPEKGTVGASGDLTPCAHMALALMGEGFFLSRDGGKLSASEVLARAGIACHGLKRRDGLALVNGVSAMTGIAALNASRARCALGWSTRLTVAHAELLRGRTESWRAEFGEARPHPGQIAIHATLNRLAAGSSHLESARAAARIVRRGDAPTIEQDRTPQDAYTIRCAPQALGAVHDMLRMHDEIVTTELNAASDNPIFAEDAPFALHGGNFYGQHVAFASDMLFNAVAKLAIVAERQIARLTDEKLNEGLPPFLQPAHPGLQSGFMGAQVTASALLAEIRTRATPASIQSISTNGANQDIVTMGTIAARKTRDALDDTFRILAIQALCVAQAVDCRRDEGDAPFSASTDALHAFVRTVSPRLRNDRPLHGDIEDLSEHMQVLAHDGDGIAE